MPVLPSRDLGTTTDFHSRLGFTVDGHYPADGYLILIRDDVEPRFTPTGGGRASARTPPRCPDCWT